MRAAVVQVRQAVRPQVCQSVAIQVTFRVTRIFQHRFQRAAIGVVITLHRSIGAHPYFVFCAHDRTRYYLRVRYHVSHGDVGRVGVHVVRSVSPGELAVHATDLVRPPRLHLGFEYFRYRVAVSCELQFRFSLGDTQRTFQRRHVALYRRVGHLRPYFLQIPSKLQLHLTVTFAMLRARSVGYGVAFGFGNDEVYEVCGGIVQANRHSFVRAIGKPA